MEKRNTGVAFAVSAYIFWSLTPLFWKLFPGINSFELLAHRMFWGFFISMIPILISGSWGEFVSVLKKPGQMGMIALRAAFLGINWYVYIWAVGNGRILEASLGYYLNPLVSIFLGMVFLKEKLNRLQIIAVAFAVAGVAMKTMLVGRFPYVSVLLAASFGLYGLLKKKKAEKSFTGLGLENIVLLPVAIVYLVNSESSGSGIFIDGDLSLKLLLVATGVISVTPLYLYAKAAGRIPLTWLGFLQFLVPTSFLFLGIFMYGETMSTFDLAGFASVWIGIVIFLISTRKKNRIAQ